MLVLSNKWNSIRRLLLAILVLNFVGCAHQEVDEHSLSEIKSNDAVALQRLFIGENKIISTSNYILEYNYETGFEPVCDDLFCSHAGKKCPAYFAESEKENYMRSYSFEYNDKLFLLNNYEGDTMRAEDESLGFTQTYYLEFVKADVNGKNREKVAEIPLYIRQSPSDTTMAICGNTLWVTGWKEKDTKITIDEVTQKSQFSWESTNILYQINLDTFEYKEVMTWKTREADIMELIASEQDVYVNSCYLLEDGYTNESVVMHYSIDTTESEQLLIDGYPCLIGIYHQYMFYSDDDGRLCRYDSSKQKYTCIDENFIACTLFSNGIVGKVIGEGFQILSFDGKTREKLETGDMDFIIAAVGDKVFYFIGNKIYWVYRTELADSDEKGVLISSIIGATYELEEGLIWK